MDKYMVCPHSILPTFDNDNHITLVETNDEIVKLVLCDGCQNMVKGYYAQVLIDKALEYVYKPIIETNKQLMEQIKELKGK